MRTVFDDGAIGIHRTTLTTNSKLKFNPRAVVTPETRFLAIFLGTSGKTPRTGIVAPDCDAMKFSEVLLTHPFRQLQPALSRAIDILGQFS